MVTHIAEKTVENYELYPNPTNGKLSIEWPMAHGSMEIYTLLGQKVYGQALIRGLNQVALPMDNMGSGIYLLRLRSEGQTVGNEKLVINR